MHNVVIVLNTCKNHNVYRQETMNMYHGIFVIRLLSQKANGQVSVYSSHAYLLVLFKRNIKLLGQCDEGILRKEHIYENR